MEFNQFSIRGGIVWSKKMTPMDGAGRKGTCHLPLCSAPSLSAGWDLNTWMQWVSSCGQKCKTTDMRFKRTSEWLSSWCRSFMNWWENVCWAFQATSRVRNVARLGIFCWCCSTALLLILFIYFLLKPCTGTEGKHQFILSFLSFLEEN